MDAAALYAAGAEHFKKDEIDAAVECFRKSAKADPKFFRAWAYLGMSYARQGKIDQAIEAYRECISIEPGYHKAMNNVGELYLRKGLLSYAAMVFKMAVEVAPEQPHYFFNLGIAWSEIGMKAEAEKALTRACELDPADAAAVSELVQLRTLQEKYGAAIEALEKFLQANPGHGRAEELRARVNALRQKVPEQSP